MEEAGENRSNVKELAIAVVKDFLQKKQLISTLEILYVESPYCKTTDIKREYIIECLNLEKTQKKNQKRSCTFNTLLELILKKLINYEAKAKFINQVSSKHTDTSSIKHEKKSENGNCLTPYAELRVTAVKEIVSNKISDSECEYIPEEAIDLLKKIISKQKWNCRKRNEKSSSQCTSSIQELPKTSKDCSHGVSNNKSLMHASKIPGMSREIITSNDSMYYTERPITIREACELRLLLFGNTHASFGVDWVSQGFKFKETAQTYGLIQNQPGPCGFLAAIQGHLLCEFLFGYAQSVLDKEKNIPFPVRLVPDKDEKKMILSRALTFILLEAGDGMEAIVVTKEDKLAFKDNSHAIEKDGLLEFAHLKIFKQEKYLLEYFNNTVPYMMTDESSSCITFLYSLILTRGIERIRKEMDDPKSCLIGEDGYCSQEIVNLILIGKAVTNTFDGDKQLYAAEEAQTIYKGLNKQSKIGFLSMLEYRGSMKVGKFYKNPVYPIWIMCTENHFSVLFSALNNIPKKVNIGDSFTLFHYDGLVNKDKEIAYFIEITENTPKDKDFTHPAVEMCILTKWPHAKITVREF